MEEEKLKDFQATALGLEGQELKTIQLPQVFRTPVRSDLIKRAFLAISSSRIQPQGRNPMAGKRTTAESWGVGHGFARVPRVKGTSRAAFIPGSVGGRKAHPPLVEKKVKENINKKEKRLALKSAIAATASRFWVARRGHVVAEIERLPIVVVDELQELEKTGEIKDFLVKIGAWADVLKAKEGVKLRAGKGKRRGRRYEKPKSLLLVVHDGRKAFRGARNLPGVNVVEVRNLNVGHLAPGGVPGRLTLWTEAALGYLAERWS